MLKDITLGQYFPGETVIHRMDPRVKIIVTFAYIITLFLADNPAGYALMFLTLAAVIVISKISLKVIFRSMKPLLFIIVFTAVLNMFYSGGDDIIFKIWIFKLTWQGLERAIYMVLRISMLVVGTFVLLTYTTSPIKLTDGIESLLKPLQKIHMPVHHFR